MLLGMVRQLAKLIGSPTSVTVKERIPYEDVVFSARLARAAYIDRERKDGDEEEENAKARSMLDDMQFAGALRFFDARRKPVERLEDVTTKDTSVATIETPDTRFHCTQAYAWIPRENDGTVYLFFRGTESKRDVLADIDIRRRKLGCDCGALVHRGFLQQFNAIEDHMTAFLRENVQAKGGKISRVVCTGHSLGGALATIAATFYAEPDAVIPGHVLSTDCHTFGCPRVGNDAFSKFFASRVRAEGAWRVFDYEDPVPMIPISCRFSHVKGNGLCLGEGGRIKMSAIDTPWVLRPLQSFVTLHLLNPFAAHDMSNYVSKTEGLFRRYEYILLQTNYVTPEHNRKQEYKHTSKM